MNVLEFMRQRVNRFGKVTIVGESLGTVIAADALNLINCENLQVITLGSPLDHIFSHYFPHLYEPGKYERAKFDKWTNIYRKNDFVGTRIECVVAKVENIDVGPKGHFGYWSDREVVDKIWTHARL